VNVENERSRSLWMDVRVAPGAAPLKRDVKAVTVVIGSGIAGLSTAYELSRQGQKVVVVDRGRIGSGMTARTSAHLSANNHDGFKTFIDRRGEKLAQDYYVSQAAAISRIETIQQSESIACDFRRVDGFLFPGPQTDQSEIDAERDASEKAGMPVEVAVGLPFRGHAKTRCLRYPDQATFHPTKYLRGLAQCIQARDGRLFADTPVTGVAEKDGAVVVETESGHTAHARYAVVATNSPINDRVALHAKQAPYRTYAMALALSHGALPDALYWDTLEPYHYVRMHPGKTHDHLIVGGADHKSGEADDAEFRYEALQAWIRNLVPALGGVTHRWSGQVMETIDYSSFSGRNPGNENVYVHTGDSGQGITHGVVGSLIVASAIAQGRALWQELYGPGRKTASAFSTFISENITAVKNFAEYVAPGEVGSFDEIKPGKGAIVRHGLQKVAAYLDAKGGLHARSAACTHLGCHLRWNSFEQCWDCPCHGSQFSVDGAVLNGPAIHPLAKVDIAPEEKRKVRPPVDRMGHTMADESEAMRFAPLIGNAAIYLWAELPAAIQEKLFEHAVVIGHQSERDESMREQLARLLHDHHPRMQQGRNGNP
jgi:glycine/D-amino acid oxidase-like deaminating enzyme/nitrite reductase/ring-hydroxylating ferredoxin subunit